MTAFFQHVGEAGGVRDFPRTVGAVKDGLKHSGNTRNIAERAARDLGADIAEVHSARYEFGRLSLSARSVRQLAWQTAGHQCQRSASR